jgi:hypothetical protein
MANGMQETRQKRFQFLERLYELTEGNSLVTVNLWELGAELGLSRAETDSIDEFLSGEGLIKHVAFGGTITITHQGVIQAEALLSKLDAPVTDSPAVNLIHVEQMIGSQIQQGTSQSFQVLNFNNEDLDAILKFVNEPKSRVSELELAPKVQAEIESDISTVESQIKSPRPKFRIIQECLLSIRSVLEGIAGNTIASLLIQYINTLPK